MCHKEKKQAMKVRINDREMDISCRTVAELAEAKQLPATGVALAIGNVMVPRDEWKTREIKEGDDIVILKAFCGG